MDLLPKALLLVLFLCALCGTSGSIDFCCGTIVPETPVLELGKEFTATCILSEYGRQYTRATADDISWMFRNVTVDRKYYTKINESAISITVNITEETKSPLKCNVISHVLSHPESKNVYGMLFTVGYPPEMPKNLSCWVLQSGDQLSHIMSCTWNPGARDPLLKTTYSLHARYYTNISNMSIQKNYGELDFQTMPIYTTVTIQVEAENELGKVSSEVLYDPVNILKMNPPKNVKVTTEGFPTTLMVKWKRSINLPQLVLRHTIRFSAVGASVWSEIPVGDIPPENESFRLQNLQPYTDYVVQIRCMNTRDPMYWSEWSTNVTEKTPEDKPSSRPDLWRIIIPSEINSEKRVKLKWKDPLHSNGKILGYNLTITNRDKREILHMGPNEREYTLSSGKHNIRVTVTANNSVGISPPAVLTLNKEHPPVEAVTCVSQDEKLWVYWQLPNSTHVTEFLLEWEEAGQTVWQREPGSSRSAVLKGNFLPFKFYNISVYPLYQSVPGKPYTVGAYLKQGVPLMSPALKVEKSGKNEIELEWSPIPLEKRQGFIVNYIIFYEDSKGERKSEVIGPEVYTYKLKSLASNAKYDVWIIPSTIAGPSQESSRLTVTTRQYAVGEIEAIVVSVCIGFLFLTVMTMAVCINKNKMIKKHIWPQVPDPSNSTIANWSPDFPSRPASPKEGSMTDVSVVEVDIFDKKSMNEEMLKKDKYSSEEHSSGIGGSSCMSSPRQSVSDCDEGDSGQTTASTVQYSSVVASGYKGQTPASLPPFIRSESTQPLLDSEERPEDLHVQEGSGHLPAHRNPRHPYFRRPWAVSEDNPLNLQQIEIGEQNSSSLGFCPVEEGSQQTTPTTENVPAAGSASSGPSYMPQASGYRPQ
ncbi:interleukin-6 receptor subunit beta isoform X2 [Scleropages formosus]|uniref:interleukin-6 receptor subunit beta isoform X2 n=1 Tax=Scleropages formosus TaxID=113540 RepID=UPI000878E3E4|nr:interleukin-6 receptor subunit beta isoform X2 [Scleropages formosus]